MRLILVALFVLPLTVLAQSKKDIPQFGKVTKEELASTTCEFDKNAEAIVLVDAGKMNLDLNGPEPYQELQHHVRIKILKDEGLGYADIKLNYEHFLNEQDIFNVVAQTYNLDASGNIVVTKLDKKLIYDKKITAKYSQKSFTLPDVKVGSVIEYKYVFRGYDNGNWVMQNSIPVKLSSFEVNFPGMIEIHTRSFCRYPLQSKDESTALRTIKRYQMENIPGLKKEEYVTCKRDYLERIECWPIAINYQGRRIPLIKTWTQVAKSLIDDSEFGEQLKKDIPRTAELDAALKTITDPYLKMVTVHNYVRSNMKWDGVNNFWASTGVKTAWKEKTGTTGEINLILINLLRGAGIKVDPLMVSTRDNGRVSISFPNVYQFNKVMALVEIDEKKYVLDATDKYTHPGLIPEDVMATEAMIIDPTSPIAFRWIELWDDSHTDKNVVILQAKITPDGKMEGHASITSRDYGRTKRTPAVSNKDQFIKAFIASGKADYTIDQFQLKNQETDSLPLIQEFDFKAPVNSSGEYAYFSTNMFGGFGANPFISDERVADVFFGTNQLHQIITNITIPEGYTFEELPKNMKLTLEDNSLSITRIIAAKDNVINTRTTLEFKRPFYSPDEYANLKEFYKKMYSLLDEQIVIKKKA